MNKGARRCMFVSKTWQISRTHSLSCENEHRTHNIPGFLCLRTYQKRSWKYVNTTEKIGKVTTTLSLIWIRFINSNNDFDIDFVGWIRVIKTPCLFYLQSLKFHYIKETNLDSSLSALAKLLHHLSTQDNKRNLCQNLLTIENTDSDLKVHALQQLHYANEPLKNFCIIANANKRSNNKLSKIGFGYG